ncbi:coiled-coil domain-containing protein 81 [Strigops habroptila]|uniref:coiled-coil domain-containing protein 81 n=1 Tax=Strigops habroptila TaxID=2489341 RepID=UPI0011CF760D|nr:coiled-coil domain-containing protein 81 [Strigops habroptila]
MMKYLLFKGLGPDDLPTLKQLTTNEICKVWAGTSKYIQKQLFEKKAVEIGIGTFALVLVRVTVGEDKVLPVERPVFQLCRFMKKFYKLKCAKTKIPEETPFVQLDFEQIGADIHFRREIVERCIHETLLFFAEALRDKKEVEFSFRSVGILAVRRSVVSMTFFDDCLLELDVTGNMKAALLRNPKMMRIVAFAGRNDYSRLSQDGVIMLPRLAVVIPHQALDHVMSLKPRRESAPWGEGARRGNVPAECWQGSVGTHLILMRAGESRSLREVWERRRQLCKPAQPSWSMQVTDSGSSDLETRAAKGAFQQLCLELSHFSIPPSGECLLPVEVREGAGTKSCSGVAGGSVGFQSWSRFSVGKGERTLEPWLPGVASTVVSVLDPVFLAQRRVSLAKLKDRKVEQIKAIEASRARFLPVIEEKSRDELKQPRPPAWPSMQLPEYALQPSGTEMSSLHTERADKQLRLLMAFKRQEVEAEVWRKYHASRTGQSMEPGKSPCHYVFEDPYCPPHLLRKAYAKELKERLQEKEMLQEERCQSTARQTASKGQVELRLLGRAWGE